MLEKEKAIDAVLIATPDHLHAYVSILAMKAGKHVYCEKPLTHNIREARLVAQVAKETGVATQMGNQGRSSEGHRQTVEWIKDGAIGAVREVHAWSGNPRTRRHPTAGREGPRDEACRASTGTSGWAHGPTGRTTAATRRSAGAGWWDFGNGTMPDMAPHHFDPAFNALGLDTPLTMEATRLVRRSRDVLRGATWSPTATAAHGDRGPLTVYWYDNGLRPPTPLGVDPDDPRQRLGEGDNGLLIVGEKGLLTCAGWSGMPRLLPLDLHLDYKRPREDPPARRRPSRRLAPGVQRRHAGVQQLRVRRTAHRVRPAGHAGAADGQGASSGTRPGMAVDQRARGAAVHRGDLPQGMGTAGLGCRQRECRPDAAHRRGVERDHAAVQLGQVADDRQAEAGAGRGFVGPHAALQHRVAHRRLESRAVVVDGRSTMRVALARRRDRDARARPLARVVEEVAEHLVEVLALRRARRGPAATSTSIVTPRSACRRAQRPGQAVRRLADRTRARRRGAAGRAGARLREVVVDLPPHALDLLRR